MLIDFGFSEIISKDKKKCGTPGYIAPEILRNQHYDAKIDVFSSGVVLFKMFHKKKKIKNQLFYLLL